MTLRVTFAIGNLRDTFLAGLLASDHLEVCGLPPEVGSGSDRYFADLHPRLQRRDRHGFTPCSGMQESFSQVRLNYAGRAFLSNAFRQCRLFPLGVRLYGKVCICFVPGGKGGPGRSIAADKAAAGS